MLDVMLKKLQQKVHITKILLERPETTFFAQESDLPWTRDSYTSKVREHCNDQGIAMCFPFW